MSSPEVFHLSNGPLTAHSFSPDRSQVVVSENSNVAKIYTRTASGFELSVTLAEHDKLITSLDWAPNTNRIVTCSQDRNAYVFSLNAEGEWKPTLVLLGINRAATHVRWSPNEDKFAVASGDRVIAVCSYDEENNWWVAKRLKKPIRSTVLSVDWHPNNILLASGGADMKARVFSAWIKDIEAKPQANIWGSKLPFNAVCGEYGSSSGGWVHSVAFSANGDAMAFCSHDSSITVVYPSPDGSSPAIVHKVRVASLPFASLLWTSATSIIAAGHDCAPFLFSGSAEGGWSLTRSLDDPAANKAGGGGGILQPTGGSVGRLNSEAFKTFRSADSRGGPSAGGPVAAGGGAGGGELGTVHQNTITSVRAYEWAENGDVKRVSTSGVDGRLVIWDVTAGAGGGGIAGRMGRMGL